MNFTQHDIVFQEIPGEISLAFSISGCGLRCAGCHSPELWNEQNGTALNTETLEALLKKYENLITTVLFLGGEWFPEKLLELLG